MTGTRHSRRQILKSVAALGAVGIGNAHAQAKGPARYAARAAGAPLPAQREFVIRNATVLTMDNKLGDFAGGDVHVRDGAIVAVGRKLATGRIQSIDGTDMICMPGLIDTHWHLWTSMFRPWVHTDDDATGYFPVSFKLGQLMSADDSYKSVRLGIAEALSAGVTTVHNWCHNTRSPAHADAEMSAMRDLGIRGRFAYGTPQGFPDDQVMDLADLERCKRDWLRPDGMLALGICSRNIGAMSIGGATRGVITTELAQKDWGGARKRGLPITMHTSGPSAIMVMENAGLLGADVQLVHALLTSPEEREILKRRGVSYSMAPTGESRRPAAVGVTQFAELLEAGIKCSVSTDHTTDYSCDLFNALRILFHEHEHRVGSKKVPVTMKRMVQLATIDGAVDLGVQDKVGSLTPGKRADIILVRTTDINMSPMGDPYDALVSLAQPSNVDTVIVDGRILRRGNRFTALDHARVVREAKAATEALRAKAKFPA